MSTFLKLSVRITKTKWRPVRKFFVMTSRSLVSPSNAASRADTFGSALGESGQKTMTSHRARTHLGQMVDPRKLIEHIMCNRRGDVDSQNGAIEVIVMMMSCEVGQGELNKCKLDHQNMFEYA